MYIVQERVNMYIAPEAECTSQEPKLLPRILGHRRPSALCRSVSTS